MNKLGLLYIVLSSLLIANVASKRYGLRELWSDSDALDWRNLKMKNKQRSLVSDYVSGLVGKTYKRINLQTGQVYTMRYMLVLKRYLNAKKISDNGMVPGTGTIAERIAALEGTSFTEGGYTYTWYPKDRYLVAMLPQVYAKYGPRSLKMNGLAKAGQHNYPSRALKRRRTLKKIRKLVKELISEYDNLN